MLRLLLILALLFYVLYKLGLFRIFIYQAKEGYRETVRKNDGVRIDRSSSKQKKKPEIKGGEYIDYEEVKDS